MPAYFLQAGSCTRGSRCRRSFEEAIDQDFVKKNPACKLILPSQLRPVDKTTLTWDQPRLVLASVPLRDRIPLTLDMTETFRPSELFALR